MPIQIKIDLLKNRMQLGTITVFDSAGTILTGPFEALGKADNAAATARGNDTRNPVRSYGDTPTGKYRGFLNQLARTPINDRTYGPQAIITLDPISGQAKTAKENGRFGLLIHGGDLNTSGRLRPTFGCVRVANSSMVSILASIPATERIDVVVTET